MSSNLIFKPIPNIIDSLASKSASRIALTYQGKSLTYGQLNTLSNQLAHGLIELGVTKGAPVGILINRSLYMLVALLAVLRAGAVYVPIDPDYPSDRIDFIFKDTELSFLLSETKSIGNIKFKGKTILLDHFSLIQHQQLSNKPNILLTENDLAYIIYTSGSTGTPKGVQVSHGNLFHAYSSWQQVYQLQENYCHLQMANFSFDVFTGDVVRALCSGGKLVLCPKNVLLQPTELYSLMRKEKINCAEFVPTVIRRLIEYLEHENLTLDFMELLVVGSDNWSIGEYCKLKRLCGPETRVISSYGLTEATIDSTYFEEPLAEAKYKYEHSVPIGKPFPNTKLYILDGNSNHILTGEKGEIYIGGSGIALGYLNRSELNQEKFLTLLLPEGEKRVYKTGDFGRLLPDGNIEFLGRIDNQVKLRGMRIELSDIENALTCHPAIRESLVVLAKDEANHERLVAYMVLESDHSTGISELRQYLKSKLPGYMVPTAFIPLDSLPTTPNGKLERATLASSLVSSHDNLILPRTSTEKQLAGIWGRILHITTVGIFNHFDDMGGDSLSLVTLMTEVEKHFKIKIHNCQLTKHLTLSDLAVLVENHLKPERKFENKQIINEVK